MVEGPTINNAVPSAECNAIIKRHGHNGKWNYGFSDCLAYLYCGGYEDII